MFGRDARREPQVARVARHLLAHRGYPQDEQALPAALVAHAGQVQDGFFLVARAHVDRHRNARHAQTRRLRRRDGDGLVR